MNDSDVTIKVKVVQEKNDLRSVTDAINRSAMKMQNVQMMIDKAAKQSAKHFKDAYVPLENIMPKVNAEFTSFDKVMEGINKKIKPQRVQFAGYALSIMFFGMAIQRVFSSIQRFGTKAFQDTMHSVIGTVTQTDLLNASFQYLGFTIGQALEPVVAWLVPIVESVAEWVSEHPKLTAAIVATGAALGTILSTMGALKLAFDGFHTVAQMAGLDSAAAFDSLGLSLGAASVWLAGIVALLYVIGKSLKETPEAANSLVDSFKGVWDRLKELGKSILDFLGSIFDVNISWQDVAWTVAWFGKNTADVLKMVIDLIIVIVDILSIVINSLQAATKAAMAFWDALTGNEQGARNNLKGLVEDITSIQKAWSSIKSASLDIVSQGFDVASLAAGPRAFRQSETDRTIMNQITIYAQTHPDATNADIANAVLAGLQRAGM